MFVAWTLAAVLDASAFTYDQAAPLRTAYGATHARDGISVRDVRFTSSGDRAVTGLVIQGKGNGKHPAVLFVHWLGDPATTNHTEFEPDAVALAKRGVTSVLIDAMWAKKDWFETGRTTDVDYQRSIEQVVDLRRSLDLLLSQPNIDTTRVAYVGHDFGAMYGALLAGVDTRAQSYVLMAGTPSFSEWYLLGAKPADIPAYQAQMAPLDPPGYLARSKATAFYFQFSAHDHYITPERELEFFQAAPLPRTMSVYDVNHSLNTPDALHDRIAWLAQKLHL